MSPYRPTRRPASVFPLIDVEMKRSLPHTIGLERPRPGTAVFQMTFVLSAALQVTGSEKPSAIPAAAIPRNCGQSIPGRGAVAAPTLRGGAVAIAIAETAMANEGNAAMRSMV